MRKFLIFCLLLSGCVATEAPVWQNAEVKQVLIAEKEYYFVYPAGATMGAAGSYLEYQGCRVNFAEKLPEEPKILDSNKKSADHYDLSAYFDEAGKLIFYRAQFEDPEYVFWVDGDGEEIGRCTAFVDGMADSFSDELLYVNNEYDYRAKILPGYEIEYAADGNGFSMKKKDQSEREIDKEMVMEEYEVEISLSARSNFENYEGIADLVAKEYGGYEIEALNDGVFVNEQIGEEAVRHYFLMNEDNTVIYEAVLRVSSLRFGRHKDDFDKFAAGIELQ